MATPRPDEDRDLTSALVAILGEEGVLTSEEDRAFYGQDIYATAPMLPACIVRPRTREALARAVRAATAAGCAVVPRGGGASYTGGYLAGRPRAVVVDTARLDRILEVNPEDMYVTVECGCTWKSVWLALADKGVRTPFWGPLSGAVATVGGSLSQNAILWGSARYGVSAESVLGLEVVLADGSIVRTGSGGTRGARPFFRYYGPDLTGLFLGDTGALGIKAAATLRLIPTPTAVLTASFAFETHEALAAAMTEVARQGLASECFGMDPVLQRQRMKRVSLAQGVKALTGVVGSARSLAEGVRDAAKVALAGRRFLDDVPYSMHVCVEGRDDAVVESALAEVRRIGTREGREIESSIPRVMRGEPFMPLTASIGPEGERWAPLHAVLPLSQVASAWSSVRALLAERAEEMARNEVVVGVLVATAGAAFVLEPVFYWPGPRPTYYDRVLEPSFLARLKTFGPHPEAAALVAELRRLLLKRFLGMGAAHLQIGRTYPYKEGRDGAAWALLESVKRAVDPAGLMNPGSLGL